ncbi:MAG: tRNA 2-thiouridine(34) synthase MnmA [Desulfarculus sp.]|nr:tRNA 2-thiouridine(34) synthase MnmA [Desulfarculus sp.]
MARIAAALSGGVDSALAAWLLARQGYEVVGLSLSLGQGRDEAPAAGGAVARQLGLEHQVVPAQREFADQVVRPSLEAYARGTTPNPCARCNARVKFPLLWQAAQDLGCEALATGHYARLVEDAAGRRLAEASHQGKSQAYFLARLAQEMLGRLMFPLGEMSKPQVRDMARQAGLEVAQRPESQDACFLPPGGWDELMAAHGLVRPGTVEDQAGRVLATHGGLHRFTIGQRRGLGVALGQPAYVLALDGPRAAVLVGPAPGLYCQGLWGAAPRWFAPPPTGGGLTVRVRYAHQGVGCRVSEEGERLRVDFLEPQRAVAPGQLAVFFHRGELWGSAWITEAIHLKNNGITS